MKSTSILLIDDEPEAFPLELRGRGITTSTIHPQDLASDHLLSANLILVDYRLTNWPERERLQLSCRPMDGLALAGLIRAHLRAEPKEQPTAIALYSANLQDLTEGEPVRQEHLVARAYGLEWVFPKTGHPEEQFASLAQAVGELPETWLPNNFEAVRERLLKLLGIDNAEISSWAALAWADIEKCHPPIHELYCWTDGLAILRWLLHRILPYPCFLWDTYQLASRLRVKHVWLKEQIEDTDGILWKLLEPYLYCGALDRFLGSRWWGAGIDTMLWEQTEGRSSSASVVHGFLRQALGTDVAFFEGQDPVFTIGASYSRDPEMSAMRECVRIQPDDWPSYAEQAWTKRSHIQEHPSLRALVLESDLESLDV